MYCFPEVQQVLTVFGLTEGDFTSFPTTSNPKTIFNEQRQWFESFLFSVFIDRLLLLFLTDLLHVFLQLTMKTWIKIFSVHH